MEIEQITDKLLEIKKQVELYKIQKAQEQGKLNVLSERMLKEYDCKTMDELKALLRGLKSHIEKEQKLLEIKLKDLEEVLVSKGE